MTPTLPERRVSASCASETESDRERERENEVAVPDAFLCEVDVVVVIEKGYRLWLEAEAPEEDLSRFWDILSPESTEISFTSIGELDRDGAPFEEASSVNTELGKTFERKREQSSGNLVLNL